VRAEDYTGGIAKRLDIAEIGKVITELDDVGNATEVFD